MGGGGGTPAEDRSEIVFFHIKTTIPFRTGQWNAIVEFGSILVSPKKLLVLKTYSTLVRPTDFNLISPQFNDFASSSTFADISDHVYDILHGRIWAGYGILEFDCQRIREAFSEIGRNPPEPKRIIDLLGLLTQRFGSRAGDMKLETLAAYFGLGNQTHRSLDYVKMSFEVLKYCATVMFLESSLLDELTENSFTTPETSSSRCRNINTSPLQSPADRKTGENSTTKPLSSFVSLKEVQTNPFDMSTLRNEISPEVVQSGHQSETVASEGFLDTDGISIPSIRATQIPLYDGSHIMKLQLFHGDRPLRLRCPRLTVHFGINGKFTDNFGNLKLNFVVDLYSSLFNVLRECDEVAKTASIDSGSSSDWNPVVTIDSFSNSPTARIHIPRKNVDRYAVEIHQKEFSGNPNAEELKAMVTRGTVLHAFLSLESYDYQQRAGIRLVGRKLVIC